MQTDAASPRKVAVASAVGATIEWYDFFLYGTAAGLVFDQLFFSGLSGRPPSSPRSAPSPSASWPARSAASSSATSATGSAARRADLDAGDHGRRHGRDRPAAVVRPIGVWAPILLVTLRILQGIAVGGEWGGAVLLAVESAPPGRRGFFGSFAQIGVPVGVLLAYGAFGDRRAPDEAFLAWGWRACSCSACFLLAIGAWIRLSVMETPAFEKVQEAEEVSAMPVKELFRKQPRTLLLGMGTRFIEGFTFNLFSVYLLAYAVKTVGVPKSTVLNAIMAGAVVGVALVIVSGRLSDRFGRKPVYNVGTTIALLFAFPAAWLLQGGTTLGVAITFVGGLGVVYGIVQFVAATLNGDVEGLLRVLAPGVELVADGGGLVRAPLPPVAGADKVVRFLVAAAGRSEPGQTVEVRELNGGPAVVVRDASGVAAAAVLIAVADDRVARIFLVGNPHKLARLSSAAAPPPH